MAADDYRFRAMASEVQVIVVDGPPESGAVACRAIKQLEQIWSRFVKTSDISRINRQTGESVHVALPTITLLETMAEAWRMTGGLFDPTVLPALVDAGYVTSIDDPTARTSLPDVPAGAQLEGLSFDQLYLDYNGCVTVPVGMAIDAGGLGKGLAADLVVAELLARGAHGVLVSIGGDLSAAGDPPEPDGWRLAVENPLDPAMTLAEISFTGGGVATSSTRSRRWTHDNSERHHVIDPRTRKPATSDLVAVTVISSCGWQAEAHATAVLLGGRDRFDDYTANGRVEAIATAVDGTTSATRNLIGLVPDRVTS